MTLAIASCRPSCGACCIAPSIAHMPGMPNGKPAGVRCLHLREDLRCAIYDRPERPACCSGLRPSPEMCGETQAQALVWLTTLEEQTS